MAFLCPIRIPKRRRKRKEDAKKTVQNGSPGGRITGSNSVDSLVEIAKAVEEEEIEFEPRKMVVLHDFIPCVEDEIAVKRGERVKALYQETDWIYIINSRNKEGFIPFTYCLTEDEYEKRKEKQKANGLNRTNFRNASFLDSIESQPGPTSVSSFAKINFGEYVVRFDYEGIDEGDITAKKGDMVTVLNKDDPDWFWVSKRNKQEGFIPKDFIIKADQISLHRSGDSGSHSSRSSATTSSQSSPRSVTFLNSSPTTTPYIRLDTSATRMDTTPTRPDTMATRPNSMATRMNTLVTVIETMGTRLDTMATRMNTSPTMKVTTSTDSIVMATKIDPGELTVNTSTPLAPLAFQPATASRLSVTGNNRSRRNSNDLLIYGQELVCIDTHKAQQSDELSVFKGDWVYADMKHKDARGWIWAYSPASKAQGFVPKACLRPPATTPL